MYYNYSEEEKQFLHVTYSLLEDGYSVEEIIDLWECMDEQQVEGVLGDLVLSESVNMSDEKLIYIYERFGAKALGGFLSKQGSKLFQGLKGLGSRLAGKGNMVSKGRGGRVRVTGQGQRIPKRQKVKDALGGLGSFVKKHPLITAMGAGAGILGFNALTGEPEKQGPTPVTFDKPGESTLPGQQTKGDGGKKKDGLPWWKTYPRASAPQSTYRSSKKFYDNIRN